MFEVILIIIILGLIGGLFFLIYYVVCRLRDFYLPLEKENKDLKAEIDKIKIFSEMKYEELKSIVREEFEKELEINRKEIDDLKAKIHEFEKKEVATSKELEIKDKEIHKLEKKANTHYDNTKIALAEKDQIIENLTKANGELRQIDKERKKEEEMRKKIMKEIREKKKDRIVDDMVDF